MQNRSVPEIDFSPIGDLYKTYQQARQRAQRDQALSDFAQNSSQFDPSIRSLIAADPETGFSLARIAEASTRDARDFTFRQQEANRSQGNTDRSFGLQERQVNTGDSRDVRDFAFREQEALRAQGNTDRTFELKKQEQDKDDKPLIVPFGAGVMKRSGEMIREPSGEASLDSRTLDFMARQYMAGDTSVLTNLGRGAQGAQNVVALRKRVAEINQEQGQGGADQAGRNAEFFGIKAGQRTLGTRSANIELAATEFKQVLPVVMEASNGVNRTQYRDLNKIIQSFEERTGDPAIVKFGGGVNTLINLYARAISPSGVPTVSDKDHAREILNKAWSQGQFNAAVGMMQQEIDAALSSPEKVRDDMRKRFLGGQPASGQPAPQVQPRAAPPQAVDDLRRNPRLAEQFDEMYGIGSAARVLGVMR